jgi:hypothetical protein
MTPLTSPPTNVRPSPVLTLFIMGKVASPKVKLRNSAQLKLTHAGKRTMIATLAETGNISEACRLINIGRRTHYAWMQEDEEYRRAVDDAMETAADLLEKEARRRAVQGVDEPVFYKGDECGAVTRYSDTLLIFLLKGVRPEKFRDRYEMTGKDGQPLGPQIVIVLPDNVRRNEIDVTPTTTHASLPPSSR